MNSEKKEAVKIVQTAGRDNLGEFARILLATMMTYFLARCGRRMMCFPCMIEAL